MPVKSLNNNRYTNNNKINNLYNNKIIKMVLSPNITSLHYNNNNNKFKT